MKNKSTFSRIMLIVFVAIICVVITIVAALLFGSIKEELFDFRNLNITNMIPVILIGGFITCIVLVILGLYLSHHLFEKSRNYFFEKDKTEENKK